MNTAVRQDILRKSVNILSLTFGPMLACYKRNMMYSASTSDVLIPYHTVTAYACNAGAAYLYRSSISRCHKVSDIIITGCKSCADAQNSGDHCSYDSSVASIYISERREYFCSSEKQSSSLHQQQAPFSTWKHSRSSSRATFFR